MNAKKLSERNPAKPVSLLVRLVEFLFLGVVGIYLLQNFGNSLPWITFTVALPMFLIGSEKSRSRLGQVAKEILSEQTPVIAVELSDAQLRLRDAKLVGTAVIELLWYRVYFAVKHLPLGLREIPSNWYRICFERSIFDPPQLVPGEVYAKDVFARFLDKGVFRFSAADAVFKGTLSLIGAGGLAIAGAAAALTAGGIVGGIVAIFALRLLFYGTINTLIAFLYLFSSYLTLSLKLTAFLWLPLVYIVYSTPKPGAVGFENISALGKKRFSSFILIVSLLIIGCFAAKILIPTLLVQIELLSIGNLISQLVSPKELHLWHIASVANALIFVGLYYTILDPVNEATLKNMTTNPTTMFWLQATFAVRASLSCYTIFATTLIFYNHLEMIEFPTLSWQLIP